MARNSLKQRRNILKWAKHRAKLNGLPFSLELEDIQIPKSCPALGIPLFCGDSVSCENSPTLDKIVGALGYVRGNVLVVSNRANRIKQNASWYELRQLVDFYETYITRSWMQETVTIH